ncbi:MAG: ABC transporter permease [Tissierellia bacterium]|nr:ABC transporter permease [Tissierellia bacterium]
MRNFFLVLKFELLNLIRKKAFRISTIIISLIAIIALTIPVIADKFGSPIFNKDDKPIEEVEKAHYGLLIEKDSIDLAALKLLLPHIDIVDVDSKEELSQSVKDGDVEAGFIIKSPVQYEYLVMNTSTYDSKQYEMDEALLALYRDEALSAEGIDSSTVSDIYNVPIEHDVEVLGKDSMKNYLYTYILVFGLYFIVIMYGQLIAMSIASEKSNRAMEILITSTSTESLIFGKVIAGALAGIIQFAIILSAAAIAYRINAEAWEHSLDFIFDIPAEVLLTFSIFGILGYLFYLFAFGIIGALVSRTEDIGASATPVTIIFMIAFFISMFSMNAPDSLLLRIASFVPLSSFMAMFIRVSMGNVSNLHVGISLALLIISTGGIGLLGARIYALGSLMYGNPVKFRTVVKLLREQRSLNSTR